MHALQDYLLDEYDRQGILIEANPTSNGYVTRLNGYHECQIFCWAPPDELVWRPGGEHNRHGLPRGPMPWRVNAYAYGIIFSTQNTEYLLLCEAAMTLGMSRTVAETCLERLRELGVGPFYAITRQCLRRVDAFSGTYFGMDVCASLPPKAVAGVGVAISPIGSSHFELILWIWRFLSAWLGWLVGAISTLLFNI